MSELKGDIQAALDAGMQLSEKAVLLDKFDGIPVFIRRDGYNVELHPELMERPKRKTGSVTVASLESFCAFFDEYSDDNGIIFVDADPQGKRGAIFTGILNYHGAETETKPGLPNHGDFRCVYTATPSVEWLKWLSKSGVAMQQPAFLEHLEDCINLIVEPSGAEMLALIQSLEGTVNARFSNASNLHNGSMKLAYEEDVTLRSGGEPGSKPGSITVPDSMAVSLAPFEFGQQYKVKNRLKYRVTGKQLLFHYEVIDPHKIVQDAVKGQVATVAEKCGTQPFYGVAPTTK